MTTNKIGLATANLSVNVPMDERIELGLAADRAGLKFGAFVRRIILLGLATNDPLTAEQVRQIRRQYYGAACVLIFVSGMAASWLTHDEHMARRCNRCRRSGRFEEHIEVETTGTV